MDAQALLKDFSQMPLLELERFLQSLNDLVTQKRATDKSYRERFLLGKINQTVLGKEKTERYQLLIRKLESVTPLTDIEHAELLQLTEEEEIIRYERLKYLVELSQLRSITLPQLMQNMGLNRPAYV
jgi:hypothetical protein